MRRRQLHFRVSESEYLFLRRIATDREESVASVLRRFVRSAMRTHAACRKRGPFQLRDSIQRLTERHIDRNTAQAGTPLRQIRGVDPTTGRLAVVDLVHGDFLVLAVSVGCPATHRNLDSWNQLAVDLSARSVEVYGSGERRPGLPAFS